MANYSELPLRERKRRQTYAAIEDHATRLVLDRGLDIVTVEDICTAVGISRRTFFNYVDSKDIAVFGNTPRSPQQEEIAEFLRTKHDKLTHALMSLALNNAFSGEHTDAVLRAELLRRRKAISQSNPEHVSWSKQKITNFQRELSAIVVDYFTRYSDERVLETPASVEAEAMVRIVISAILMGYHQWASDEAGSYDDLARACFHALDILVTFAKKSS
ncbi:TetR/AcrR family transcriptional regulator [Corynebacterium silvaticum]|uniref:TetR/AcrR family transcriptional regulator n=1 Tax=Corynebacterium silvaticum TaxID=2320431 RepID=A0A7Y4LGZ1_9CORY|nr:TetR/AcrR family transcriptional regulator [Corynebacterium silvaticum]ARU45877.1 TetR/AcrR family transcriptional regulator [Corynebacterium silvaticum]MBH5300427.1 TetR family transcriptional regulator [Corynebacterium silvaticum]NOM64624.1 TetR family transcriptional regulator [Corynebacterium silvaticum]NON69890.1 TetR family transcriptional regulator [Corynebacterium silvaticum]TFA93271.1 TetR family transcriptional regulator [Corynebacterium silvaticum]